MLVTRTRLASSLRGCPLVAFGDGQRGKHRLQFQARLGVFSLRVGFGDNATSGKQRCSALIDQGRADCYRKLTVAVPVDPAHWPGIPPAIKSLTLMDKRKCRLAWMASYRGSRVQSLNNV